MAYFLMNKPGKKATMNKTAGYMANPVPCGWAGAIFEVTRAFGQEQWGQKIKS